MKYTITIYLYLATLLCLYSTIHTMQDMVIIMGIQEGATIANKIVNEEYQSVFQSISTEQHNLQNAISQFSHDVQIAQQHEMKNSLKIFSSAQKNMADNQGNQQEYTKQMQDYIFKSLSIHQAPKYYLLGEAPKLDELFALGTMYTPQGPIWKNPFSVGNWEYDESDDSFWQLHNEPMLSPDNQSSENAIQNSIFTEYFTRSESYSIQCQVTLHQIHYPFFAGIMFNKTRWISGNHDSITKCRMIGIYAASETDIGTYLSEQHSAKSKSGTTQALPLEQIIAKKATKLGTVDPTVMKNILKTPVTFTIKVITSPKEIKVKIWPNITKEPSEYTSVPSIAPDLYLYHGIGFVSPGAISQFSLLKPQNVLFSSSAIQAFAQEVKELTSTPEKK